jgi:DNA-binding transcriptional LysR family regulator
MLNVVIIGMRDITRLDAKLLVAFNTLMEERSVTRAAERLNMTQQGLSGVLQRMRDLFADPLFVREARGVAPTPRAEELGPRIKSALAGLEGVLESQVFDPTTADGTIFVATGDYALSSIVSPLFQKFRALAPNVRLAMLPLNPATLSEQVPGGRVDLALTIPQFAPQNWFTRRLFEERYLGAVRADHPIAGTTVDIDTFCSWEHLLVSPYRSNFTGVIDRALARINRTRRVGLTIPSFSVVGAILERTDLLAVVPERILTNMNRQLFIFPPPLEIEGTDVIAAWPERVHQDPLHEWFRELCYDSTQVDETQD